MERMVKATQREARRQARLDRRVREEARRRRDRRRGRLWIGGGAVLVAVVVGWAVWASTRPGPAPTSTAPGSSPAAAGGGQPAAAPAAPRIVTVPDQGRAHVVPGQSHPAYNSNPPASGWHYPSTAAWGFHNSALPDELLIHNLEHGGIWIAYKDDQDSAVVDPLVALAREFPRKLVITHRPANDSPIAVVAWDHVMKLDRFDRAAIVDFYNRFKNKGPEFVPD